jgi:hypothetical protein
MPDEGLQLRRPREYVAWQRMWNVVHSRGKRLLDQRLPFLKASGSGEGTSGVSCANDVVCPLTSARVKQFT